MPARSEERTNARKEEIINACEMLYQTMNFKDITIKEIGNVTSFSRTSIYNYFETKEEIFLALLKREYDAWILDLHKIVEEHESMDDEQIASAIAKSLDQRHQLLKILSMNHYDLEENSRIEMLIEFKVSYGNSLRAVMGILAKFRPDMDIEKRQEFVYAFFPFMFGIYPYTVVTKKQKKAMKEAGADLFEIKPEVPYTNADLNWMDKKARSTVEMNDPSSRPATTGTVENMEQYDNVIIGFPKMEYSL